MSLTDINSTLKNATTNLSQLNSAFGTYSGAVKKAVTAATAGELLVGSFGAVGDGVTDDTAAIQGAINQAISNSLAGNLPTTVVLTGTHFISSSILVQPSFGMIGLSIVSRSKGQLALTTTAVIPLITLDSTNGSLLDINISDMWLQGNSGGQNGIEILGFNGVGYSTFSRLLFTGMTSAFYCPVLGSPGLGTGSDWNQFTNLTMLNCNYGFNWRDFGTGNVYANGNMVLNGSGAGFYMGIGGSATIGDINFIGWQMGGSGSGFILDGGSYGGNIGVSQVQFDAGISPAWQLTNIHQLEARNVNYGGAAAIGTIDPSCTDLQLDERRAGYISIGSGTQNDFATQSGVGDLLFSISGGDLTLTGVAGGYDGKYLGIYNAGGSTNVVVKNLDAGSSAINQFFIGADVTLAPGHSLLLRYVGSSAGLSVSNRWIRRGGS